jgi:hypothetical protein
MNLAVFEDIRDISPRQGWVPPALVSAWLSDTLNRRYGAITLLREGGTIQPEGSDYAKLGTSTALTPETLWCLGWMNHDFTLFKPDLSDGERSRSWSRRTRPRRASPPRRPTRTRKTRRPTRRRTSARFACCSAATGTASSPPGCAPRRTRQIVVRDAYNRSFRGIVIATYDGGTLDLARWNEAGPQLKAHQIAGILRVLDMRGGLIAFDVGVGKTYTAIGVVAAARQEGWVHRPVVLVPSSLVWKWHDDFLCVLPDYRVLVIGSNRKQITPRKAQGPAHLGRPTHPRSAPRSGAPSGRPLRRGDPELRRARAHQDEPGGAAGLRQDRREPPAPGQAAPAQRRQEEGRGPVRARQGDPQARRARLRRGDARAAPRATSSTRASPGTTSASTC